MSYADSRDEAQMNFLRVATQQFIARWKANPRQTGRQTLFLFPGGEGSRLYRARHPYVEGGPAIQHFMFDLNWLELDSFLGTALDLEMTAQPDGTYRDTDNRIVVAYDSVSLLCTDPYAGFRDWCDAMGIDRFTFGWDWRRPIEDAAGFFRDRFLPEFRATVQDQCGTDPLADYVLLGHSFGGMVVTNLARGTPLPGTCSHVITVASPFYGYGGQIHRWFEGDDMFPLSSPGDVIRTISSFTGCYALPFLSQHTYIPFHSRIDQGAYPLTQYPSTDPLNTMTDVDPFYPRANQYPVGTGFSQTALAAGAATSHSLGIPLDAALTAQLTCFRGVVTDGNGVAVEGTAGSLTWSTLPPPPYDPSQTPLTDGPDVAGDNTLPAWTTALPGAHTIEIKNADVEHIYMLDNAETQKQLARLLGVEPVAAEALVDAPSDAIPTRPVRPGRPPIAPRAELDRVLDRLRTVAFDDGPLGREAARRELERLPAGELNALAGRALADLLKPPRRRRTTDRR